MLSVNELHTHISPDGSELVVVIDGDNIEEVSDESSELAVQEGARRGFANAGIDPMWHAYPVDAATDSALTDPMAQKVSCYRVEHKLSRRR